MFKVRSRCSIKLWQGISTSLHSWKETHISSCDKAADPHPHPKLSLQPMDATDLSGLLIQAREGMNITPGDDGTEAWRDHESGVSIESSLNMLTPDLYSCYS